MKRSLYWICQFTGWGTNFAISVFYYQTLSYRKIEYFYNLVSINVLLGLFFTHIMRLIINENKFLEKPINKSVIYFIIVTIFFSLFVFFIISCFFGFFFIMFKINFFLNFYCCLRYLKNLIFYEYLVFVSFIFFNIFNTSDTYIYILG